MIDTDAKLAAFLPELQAATWIAVDTEADSLHAYPEKLCLIQLSLATGDWLIDPLAPMKLEPALECLRRHELIFHGADYDLRLLYRGPQFVPSAIFDTMIAARLLGVKQFGLGDLVAQNLGVTLEKGPQKANWARRPLTLRMEDYARNDTRFLKPLADLLRAQLIEKGRLAWHQQACAQLITECAEVRPPDPETVWRVKGSHHLSPASLSVLRALWHWREAEARRSNKPPFFILTPQSMVHLAGAAVNSRSIESCLPRYLTPRRRDEVRKAVRHGLQDKKHPPTHVHPRPPRQTETEKRRLVDLEKRRDHHAAQLNLDPSLIASRAMLVLLSRNWTEYSAELLPWQRALLEG